MTGDGGHASGHEGHEHGAGGRELPIAESPQRVSGMRVPDAWVLPGKPADLDTLAEDAWRQTGFACGDDLRLIEANLDVQVRLAGTGYTASARTMTMAGFASLWSRALLSTSDAVSLIRRGAYQSAVPLIRQAVECIGAQQGLAANGGADLDEWRRWTHEAYGRHEPTRSTEVGLGHYFSGESIAADEHLRAIYRAASDLGRPNFGPTALFVANEANHTRYPLNFADHAFHLGWAQLLLGWALRLGVTQIHLGLHLPQQFPASDDLRAAAVAAAREAEALLADPDRCALDGWTDEEGHRRLLLVQFRRRSADAVQRLLL